MNILFKVAALIVIISLIGTYLCVAPHIQYEEQYENPETADTANSIEAILKCWLPRTTLVGFVVFVVVGVSQALIQMN